MPGSKWEGRKNTERNSRGEMEYCEPNFELKKKTKRLVRRGSKKSVLRIFAFLNVIAAAEGEVVVL